MPLGLGNEFAAATGPRLFGEFSPGSAGGVGYSVLQSRVATPAAASTSTTVNWLNPPVAGQLLVASCVVLASTAGLTFGVPTDNGSNSGWTQIQTTQAPGATGNNMAAVWYRAATATDAASLTTITFNYSGATVTAGGFCCVDHYGGFSATPTLDLSALPVTGTAALTSGVISLAAVAARAKELAVVGFMAGTGFGALLGTNQYSPNNGSAYFPLTQTGINGNAGATSRAWATSIATASSPATWQVSWTNSRAFVAFAFTFYG